VAVNCAVMPLTVWLIGNEEYRGALLKSNSTAWATEWEINIKLMQGMITVTICLKIIDFIFQ